MSASEATRGSPRTGIVLRDPLPWDDAERIVRTAEAAGYEAVFVPEIDSHEAFSTLTGFALASERLHLGTGVVTVWSRTPAVTAMAAATVADLSGGRMILGIGAGSPPGVEASEDLRAMSPIRRVEAYVTSLRDAFAGRTVTARDPFGSGGFRLGFEPAGGPPPVWLAALGDRMLRLAGRVADGVILNWCPPERVTAAREVLAASAAEAGRDPNELTIAVYVRACLGAEENVAMDVLRGMAGMYASIPHYLAQLEAFGLGKPARAAAEAFAVGRPQDVPRELVRALAVIGNREDALARFDIYRRAGADLVLCYPVAAGDAAASVMGTLLAAAPSPPDDGS